MTQITQPITLTAIVPVLPSTVSSPAFIGGVNSFTIDLTADHNTGTPPVTYNLFLATSAAGPFTYATNVGGGVTKVAAPGY